MYKEWMNEKRTKKDFRIHKDDDESRIWVRFPDGNRIHKDDDESRIWVRFPDGKSEEEVEPLNLMMDEKHRDELKEVAKKHI